MAEPRGGEGPARPPWKLHAPRPSFEVRRSAGWPPAVSHTALPLPAPHPAPPPQAAAYAARKEAERIAAEKEAEERERRMQQQVWGAGWPGRAGEAIVQC